MKRFLIRMSILFTIFFVLATSTWAEEKYRAVTQKDNLNCGARVASMEFSWDNKPPSGELIGFECLDKAGKTRKIELASTKMVEGKIKTKDFGTILMKSTGTTATYYMTESQIKKLKKFLGF